MLFHGSSIIIIGFAVLVQPSRATAVKVAKHLRDISDSFSNIAGCVGFNCVTEYIALPDENYNWYDTGERIQGEEPNSRSKWVGYVLNMTSQKWQPESVVSSPLWWHVLVVIVPDKLSFKDWATVTMDFGINLKNGNLIRIDNRESHEPRETSLQASIHIDNNNLRSSLPELKMAVSNAAYLATHAHTIAVSLLNLPNGYETFASDNSQMRRSTDFLTAYATNDFINTGAKQPERLSQLPMSKALVRAMDTVSAFTATHLPSGKVTRFGVTGYSKLGTITWMAGAFDRRIQAIVPVAISLDIRVREDNEKTLAARFAENKKKVHDPQQIRERQITDTRNEEFKVTYAAYGSMEYDKMHGIIDPSAWLSRLTIPKLYIMGSNDFHFQDHIDHVQNIFPKMLGRKAFWEVPNCRHDESLTRSLPSIAAFFHGVLLNKSMPEVWSTFDRTASTIRARQLSKHKPRSITLWSANSSLSRDFKDSQWKPLKLRPGLAWEAPIVRPPGVGYQGAFMEFEYVWPDDHHTYRISTPVWVVPF